MERKKELVWELYEALEGLKKGGARVEQDPIAKITIGWPERPSDWLALEPADTTGEQWHVRWSPSPYPW